MRIVFMGTPDFAVSTLEALVQAGHEVLLAVTQPDRPRGRHGELQKSPVRTAAESHGIPVITPLRIRKDEEAKQRIRELEPEVIVVTAFGQILPEDVLSIPVHGCINVHASLLPRYRGAAPIQWAVLNGDAVSGVTTMQMDAGLDTGDILMKREVPLDPRETGGSLFDKLARTGGELILETLEALEAGTLTRTRQPEAEATHVGMFTKAFGDIDWREPAEVIERKVRGLNPWPSAYTHLQGKQLKLWDTEVVPDETLQEPGMHSTDLHFAYFAGEDTEKTPVDGSMDSRDTGRIYTDGASLLVVCGVSVLKIHVLQLEGKKRMETADFLRGYKL